MRVLTLTRKQSGADGVFSELTREDKSVLAHTLEHAYEQPDKSFAAKIPAGTYTCVKGSHRLRCMTTTFLTFEVEGVPGCTGILFHWGNYNADSEGCILTGAAVALEQDSKTRMVTNSRETFNRFMAELSGQTSFQLIVC